MDGFDDLVVTTMSGKNVVLKIFVEHGKETRTGYAMDALKRAMKWDEDRFGLEELRRLVVNPGGAVPIALSAVADLTVNEGPNEIRRVDQQRTAVITATRERAGLEHPLESGSRVDVITAITGG